MSLCRLDVAFGEGHGDVDSLEDTYAALIDEGHYTEVLEHPVLAVGEAGVDASACLDLLAGGHGHLLTAEVAVVPGDADDGVQTAAVGPGVPALVGHGHHGAVGEGHDAGDPVAVGGAVVEILGEGLAVVGGAVGGMVGGMMNDAMGAANTPTTPADDMATFKAKIDKLTMMKEVGMLTEEEFNNMKAQLLSSIL